MSKQINWFPKSAKSIVVPTRSVPAAVPDSEEFCSGWELLTKSANMHAEVKGTFWILYQNAEEES